MLAMAITALQRRAEPMLACVCMCVCFSKNWLMCCNWFALTFNTFAVCAMCVACLSSLSVYALVSVC